MSASTGDSTVPSEVSGVLDKCGFTDQIQEALALVLEKQPADPLVFLAKQYGETCSALCSFHFLAYGRNALHEAEQYVLLNPPGSSQFLDNLATAYTLLEGDKKCVSAKLVRDLLSSLARGWPQNIRDPIMQVLESSLTGYVAYHPFCVIVERWIELQQCMTVAAEATKTKHKMKAFIEGLQRLVHSNDDTRSSLRTKSGLNSAEPAPRNVVEEILDVIDETLV